ncbi:probable serine threonine- kinase gdt4 [Paramuricea clavata]|uniref:Probable serine threonine- kinase gdt4 n=1 Tax=Paramuricea clavata TaxID=317549 RepID=A0A7D9J6F2_PARCT|nr:probable serine threonine- kinase gdt4 [Paramuricea clavata]
MNNITLYLILESKDQAPKLTQYNSIYIIELLGEAIQHLHNHGVLHNDIKSDNVMVCQANEDGNLQLVLIDFGKACKIEQAEYCDIPKKRRKMYREKHSHIAQEIVEGIAKQSTASNILSVGRIAYRLGQHVYSNEVTDLSISCTNENVIVRCSLSLVIEECYIMLSRVERDRNDSVYLVPVHLFEYYYRN